VSEAKVKSIVPYFGGKRSMARDIVQELGPHKAYFEPACGSLAVLFAKPRCSIETVSDLHGDVVNLAMVLASDRWESLYRQVDRQLLCETTIQAYRTDADFEPPAEPEHVVGEHIDRAARYLALSWIGRNGVSGSARSNYQIAVRWTQGGGSPGIRWRSAVDSVPAWHDRLKGVVILRRDMFDVIPRIQDEPGMVVYVDPPYLRETRGKGGGSRYEYDFEEAPLTGDDHSRLAEELRRFKHARVVVSYYADPRLNELYVDHGWTLRNMSRQKNLHVQNRRGAGKCVAPEVLLMNGESFADPAA
jgi:DNA adenine methylase